ncbi:hypothetical protein NBM05_03680 [Rothia sp. AR01]|uniref:Uncharacterized protein n=1 Tax=Rothia santali TaxID=2949643 RepID=A0A9X2HDG1_9MICC|nr:hypothetical protein [Rothia santali]MCP3425149.1 hypothetical protein [Rothia santali]
MTTFTNLHDFVRNATPGQTCRETKLGKEHRTITDHFLLAVRGVDENGERHIATSTIRTTYSPGRGYRSTHYPDHQLSANENFTSEKFTFPSITDGELIHVEAKRFSAKRLNEIHADALALDPTCPF